MPHRCVTVTGRASMVDQTPRYRSNDPDIEEPYDDDLTNRRVAPYRVGQSARTEELSSPHDSSRLFRPLQPRQFWSPCFLRMRHATSLPTPRLQVPPFFRLRPQRCSRNRQHVTYS